MRRVIFNQKGGVGKSSITVNLAAISAQRGLKTLVIDLDAQCNASQYLLGEVTAFADAASEKNIASFFQQFLSFKLSEKNPQAFTHVTDFDLLHVLPSSPDLNEFEHLLAAKHKIFKFRDALKQLMQSYDAIYIDTPPALNFYTLSALIGSDRCLIPFDCDAFARQGLYRLISHIREIQMDHNNALKIEGIVVNQFQPRANLPQQLVNDLAAENLPVLETKLPSSVLMKESHQKHMPLIHLNPNHKLTRAYEMLYDEINH